MNTKELYELFHDEYKETLLWGESLDANQGSVTRFAKIAGISADDVAKLHNSNDATFNSRDANEKIKNFMTLADYQGMVDEGRIQDFGTFLRGEKPTYKHLSEYTDHVIQMTAKNRNTPVFPIEQDRIKSVLKKAMKQNFPLPDKSKNRGGIGDDKK